MRTEKEKAEEKEYYEARNFVDEWLWNAEKFGDIRKCDSMGLEQCRDVAVMIVRFNKLKEPERKSETGK